MPAHGKRTYLHTAVWAARGTSTTIALDVSRALEGFEEWQLSLLLLAVGGGLPCTPDMGRVLGEQWGRGWEMVFVDCI